MTEHALSLIAEATALEGNLRVTGSLRVDGDVEGDLSATRRIQVGKSGRVCGSIVAPDVEVAGQVDGAVRGDRVRVAAGARVSGDIRAERLEIETGARLDGNCVVPLGLSGAALEAVPG